MTPTHPEGVLEPFEIRYHSAMPGWIKVIGLTIRQVPECEGGGYMLREDEWNRRTSPPPADREADRKMVIEAMARNAYGDIYDRWPNKTREVLEGISQITLATVLALPPAVRAALSRLMVG